MDGSESTSGDSNGEESIENVESPIRSVIGPNGLRKFVRPLMWMMTCIIECNLSLLNFKL